MQLRRESTLERLKGRVVDVNSNWGDQEAVKKLGLKWERTPEPCHDYHFFLKKSRDNSLLATSTSTPQSDHVTEVWSTEECTMQLRVMTPHTEAACLAWLSDNSFVTGGHDCSLTLWRDEQRVHR